MKFPSQSHSEIRGWMLPTLVTSFLAPPVWAEHENKSLRPGADGSWRHRANEEMREHL